MNIFQAFGGKPIHLDAREDARKIAKIKQIAGMIQDGTDDEILEFAGQIAELVQDAEEPEPVEAAFTGGKIPADSFVKFCRRGR